MALKGIIYKTRWEETRRDMWETQRDIYDFKKQFTANYVVK